MVLAALSISGFILRGISAIMGLALIHSKITKVAPHVIDTALLCAAIFLAWRLQANPFDTPWLLAKIVALLLYIALGTQVIKRKGSAAHQWRCFGLAILTFLYIGAVAVTKNPIPL